MDATIKIRNGPDGRSWANGWGIGRDACAGARDGGGSTHRDEDRTKCKSKKMTENGQLE
jgi:hypothetical protein